jgi:hypothetical protein
MDFHRRFCGIPESDILSEDYSCGLQKEIICAGRVYISDGHICFSSNILGWVTTLIISFDEVVAIERESTAKIFPNAIAIQTLCDRHIFRSLLNRESVFKLLTNIWNTNKPAPRGSMRGERLRAHMIRVERGGIKGSRESKSVDTVDETTVPHVYSAAGCSDMAESKGLIAESFPTLLTHSPITQKKPIYKKVPVGHEASAIKAGQLYFGWFVRTICEVLKRTISPLSRQILGIAATIIMASILMFCGPLRRSVMSVGSDPLEDTFSQHLASYVEFCRKETGVFIDRTKAHGLIPSVVCVPFAPHSCRMLNENNLSDEELCYFILMEHTRLKILEEFKENKRHKHN